MVKSDKIRILVTGANGQLGSELRDLVYYFPKFEFTFTDVEDLDITNESAIDLIFKNHSFNYLINCAAYTAVDKAESEKEKAFLINEKAVELLALKCKEHNVKFIHISTDYVFDGSQDSPINEDEATKPVSVYGASKLAGEYAVSGNLKNSSIIIRTSWLYSAYGHNFLKTMLRVGPERGKVKVVHDQKGTPTNAADLAEALLKIISHSESSGIFMPGIYHFSNEGTCTWYEFAISIFEHAGLPVSVEAIQSHEFPTPVKRPAYSVLDKTKIKASFNLIIPEWQESLKRCLKKLEENRKAV